MAKMVARHKLKFESFQTVDVKNDGSPLSVQVEDGKLYLYRLEFSGSAPKKALLVRLFRTDEEMIPDEYHSLHYLGTVPWGALVYHAFAVG